jgi:hypothetical protein
MQNSVTLALFTDNSTILSDSMTRALAEMTVSGLFGTKTVGFRLNQDLVH